MHDPMNTLSIEMSVIEIPGLSSMYWSDFAAAFSSSGFPLACSSGDGTLPVTSTVIAGFVPQLT